jgi:FkbM family methyltransferase
MVKKMLQKIWKNIYKAYKKSPISQNAPEWEIAHLASTKQALTRITSRKISIATVIDVGASNGSWSEICMEFFPDARYVLLEAQEVHRNELDLFCKTHSNAKYHLIAAGNIDGNCYFDDSDPFGGLAANEQTDNCIKQLPMVKIDTLIKTDHLQGPFLLKLDTHGFELQIIHGAEALLSNAELVIIETYIFRLNEKALIFHELCAEMDKRGFQLIDFSEPLWRTKDLALWQWDFFFVKKTNTVFNSNSYS